MAESTNGDLTAEELELLASYDNLFEKRYGEDDEEFMKNSDKPLSPPPCVENWYSRPKRTYDWTNRGRGGYEGRGGGHRGSGGGYHDRQRHYDRDRQQGRHEGHRQQGHYEGHRQHGQHQGHRHQSHYDDHRQDRQGGYRNQGQDRNQGQGYGSQRGGYGQDRVHYAGVRPHERQGQGHGQDRHHPYKQHQQRHGGQGYS